MEEPQIQRGPQRAPLPDMHPAVRRLVVAIDGFTAWTGMTIAWLNLILVFVVVYEVVLRYVFNAPSIWAYDVSYMLYGSLFMLGASYTLLYGGHIRTDLFYQRWPPRAQALVDVCFYLLIFFPGLVFFLLTGLDKTIHAFQIMERAAESPWHPVLFPFRAVIPLTALLLLIQGASELIKAFHAIARGHWR